MPHPYRKTVPGAACIYQPEDLKEYADDAWDIRISLGDAPLDEAFYFTVEDPSATQHTIRDLITNHALNRDFRNQLDIEAYPELPYVQEELIQYWQSIQSGTLCVSVYVNNAPDNRPVSLYDRADRHLSVCTYHDGSWDYRVLDLVFESEAAPLPMGTLSAWRKAYGPLTCLLGLAAVDAEEAGDLHRTVLMLLDGVDYATQMVQRTMVEHNWLAEGEDGTWALTDCGRAAATEISLEIDALRERFERFASVSVYPPALGVPDGLDVRLQLIRRSGKPVERCALLLLFDSEPEWIAADTCIAGVVDGSVFERLWTVLAYESHFTADVLTELAALGS